MEGGNKEPALLDAFRLWPPVLDDVLRCLVVGFLCLEGRAAEVQPLVRKRCPRVRRAHLCDWRKDSVGRLVDSLP